MAAGLEATRTFVMQMRHGKFHRAVRAPTSGGNLFNFQLRGRRERLVLQRGKCEP